MGKASAVADLLAALDPQAGDDVLGIGAGIAEAVPAGITVVTGDGAVAGALYDRVISTARAREFVPWSWLYRLRLGGRLVTPWGTGYTGGALLTVDFTDPTVACGRFSGSFAARRRRARIGWVPGKTADVRATHCREADLDRMLNPAKGQFAIGVRLPSASLVVGDENHVVELGDRTTGSYASLEADWTVRQCGPRRLWDEVEAAYGWWHEHGEPGADRFGVTITAGTQTVWLDEPGSVVRTLL
ncbi:hypothetical protein [Amycolatopsis sp. CA-230715]|uniref:hypothetical protein n=1 Tax=Amycolatopsis sp. CA-230715 TaxID=2745196 RepID=UPI001C01CEC0|nr:hypothetical protein [Amycolatopsis sp. CA-230715]QWF80709.1 hypothetical protein HUW46_04133 [Amycolatopsis sp. CA-230715]